MRALSQRKAATAAAAIAAPAVTTMDARVSVVLLVVRRCRGHAISWQQKEVTILRKRLLLSLQSVELELSL